MARLLRNGGRLQIHSNPLSTSAATLKSPFESNIVRLIRKTIHYRLLYFPPRKPLSEYNKFKVEDHPGEQRVTLRGNHSDNEDIKIEATLVDAPQVVEKGLGAKACLHLSLLVDVLKGEGPERLEFVCSAWPDRLEIQRVFMFKPNGLSMGPYMGPNTRTLKRQLQTGFYDYLKMRGVNDDLSVFLHSYMMKKDRAELIQWFKKLETFVES